MRQNLSGILEEMTIDDVRSLTPNVAVIPIGSTEPHGPALPYGTDNFQVEYVAYGGTRKANEMGGRVLCLPTQRVSLNNNFRAFPFACRMQVPTFMNLLKDLVAMCRTENVHRIVFVNGHGGNPDAIRATQRDLAAQDNLFTCLIGTGVLCIGRRKSLMGKSQRSRRRRRNLPNPVLAPRTRARRSDSQQFPPVSQIENATGI